MVVEEDAGAEIDVDAGLVVDDDIEEDSLMRVEEDVAAETGFGQSLSLTTSWPFGHSNNGAFSFDTQPLTTASKTKNSTRKTPRAVRVLNKPLVEEQLSKPCFIIQPP